MRPRALGTLALLALAPPAAALDRVTYPYPGVVHVHRVVPGTDAHIVTIDLNAAADVVVTPPGDRYATVSRFATEHDVQIAINANFFDESVCGLAMGQGRIWRDAYVEHCNASMAFGRRDVGWRVALFDSDGWTRESPIPWASEIVTGWPVLLRNGAVYFDEHEPNGMYRTHPRTAVGIGADGSTLVLLVMDGRRAGVPGGTSLEMIPMLEEFGAANAINLDGGGSSALYIGAEGGIVNVPSDDGERPVMDHLGIRLGH